MTRGSAGRAKTEMDDDDDDDEARPSLIDDVKGVGVNESVVRILPTIKTSIPAHVVAVMVRL
jgi:hypothetical protein